VWPSAATTTAFGTSPHLSSGTPTNGQVGHRGVLGQHALDLGGVDVSPATMIMS